MSFISLTEIQKRSFALQVALGLMDQETIHSIPTTYTQVRPNKFQSTDKFQTSALDYRQTDLVYQQAVDLCYILDGETESPSTSDTPKTPLTCKGPVGYNTITEPGDKNTAAQQSEASHVAMEQRGGFTAVFTQGWMYQDRQGCVACSEELQESEVASCEEAFQELRIDGVAQSGFSKDAKSKSQ